LRVKEKETQAKKEKNADQIIRVIRNYVSEPSFDYPADNIVYVNKFTRKYIPYTVCYIIFKVIERTVL